MAAGAFPNRYHDPLAHFASRYSRLASASVTVDAMAVFVRTLEEKKCLRSVAVPIVDRNGVSHTYKAGLTAAQARASFLDSQPQMSELALGRPATSSAVLCEAIARCGDYKCAHLPTHLRRHLPTHLRTSPPTSPHVSAHLPLGMATSPRCGPVR